MRVYTEQKVRQLTEVVCNCCGKKLLVENGILKEECVHVTHDFGFFGKRDGTSHTFDLCEESVCVSEKITQRLRFLWRQESGRNCCDRAPFLNFPEFSEDFTEQEHTCWISAY